MSARGQEIQTYRAKVQIGLRPVQKCKGKITTLQVAGGSPGGQVAGSFASMFSQPPTANRQYLIQVWRGSTSPPVSIESMGRRLRYGYPSANGRLAEPSLPEAGRLNEAAGRAVPTRVRSGEAGSRIESLWQTDSADLTGQGGHEDAGGVVRVAVSH